MAELRLHANENPWGPVGTGGHPAPELAAAGPLWQYPQDGGALEAALAGTVGCAPGSIVLGNGSTELISLLILALTGPDEAVACCAGSFVAYRMLATAAGRPLQTAPPRADGGTDLDALADALTPATRLVFLANPDNPSGTLLGAAALRAFLDRVPPRVVVVLDEAYREYVDAPDYPGPTALLGPRVVVLRTFSKAYGLAGLRCGYAVAVPPLAARLRQISGPYRVGRPTRAAALRALADPAGLAALVRRTRAARHDLAARLAARGLRCSESHTSFLMVELGQAAAPVAEALAAQGIRVQPLGLCGHPSRLRVSVGDPDHHRRLVGALDALGVGCLDEAHGRGG